MPPKQGCLPCNQDGGGCPFDEVEMKRAFQCRGGALGPTVGYFRLSLSSLICALWPSSRGPRRTGVKLAEEGVRITVLSGLPQNHSHFDAGMGHAA